MKKPKSTNEILREAIKADSRTLYRISKDSGVDYGVLHRFADGKRGLTCDTADKLCDVLGFELVRKNE